MPAGWSQSRPITTPSSSAQLLRIQAHVYETVPVGENHRERLPPAAGYRNLPLTLARCAIRNAVTGVAVEPSRRSASERVGVMTVQRVSAVPVRIGASRLEPQVVQ